LTGSESPDALIVIDIQRDYFPGGQMPLVDPERAADRAGAVLASFRQAGRPVIHVHHEATGSGSTFLIAGTEGVEPWPTVKPSEGELIVIKHFPNAFRDTSLREILDRLGVGVIAMVGMMTHMCIDATARQAADLGYRVWVAGDACATRELRHEGRSVPAPSVHAAFLAALASSYARVSDADALIRGLSR
jgi:nicotinamidase-related amidase